MTVLDRQYPMNLVNEDDNDSTTLDEMVLATSKPSQGSALEGCQPRGDAEKHMRPRRRNS